MPLRVVTRPGRTALYLRGTVRGKSVYESAGTDDPEIAEQYRAKREAELHRETIYGARAVVSFAAAAESYLTTEQRRPGTRTLVRGLTLYFKATPLMAIDQIALDKAYPAILSPDASLATRLRNVLTPLRAILEHAARRGWCDRPAFEVPTQPKGRTMWLTPRQATALVQAAAPHLRPLLVFLICTGARMSEALELDWRHVDLYAHRVRLVRTKTGIERHVDLVPAAVAALASFEHRDGRVFRPAYPVRKKRGERGQQWRLGEAYRDTDRTGGGQIKSAWRGACARASISELRPHDLRHTAATWHYAIHRDLLRLQHWGGWSSVALVQRYAHLLPEAYVSEAAAWWGVSVAERAANSA